MTRYLVSFPGAAMTLPADEWDAAYHDSHAVIEAAKAAGVYVFGGGLDDRVPVVRVSADGPVSDGANPGARPLDGGLTVRELPSREAAVEWAARIAGACRCDQELRVFHFDAAS